MAGQVHNINPQKELVLFFDFMYGNQVGYVYSPTKNPSTREWKRYFFQWPEQKEELIQHVLQQKDTHEVYYAPALFSQPDAKKENFKGTYFVFAEFDGVLPSDQALENCPQPTIRIQSSESGYEHWYWRLEYFETNQTVLESLTRRVAYALDGDYGIWNCNRVLRPVATIHHESGKQVIYLEKQDVTVPVETFVNLSEPPDRAATGKVLKPAGDLGMVLAKYAWKEEDFNFFRKGEIKRGSRSSALTRLAYLGAEQGMTNSEILAVLLNADKRWKKFDSRNDQIERLCGILDFVRAKKLQPAEPVADEFPVYGFQDFLNTEVTLEWSIQGLLQAQGLGVISSLPGVGKTQVSLQLAIHAALGKDFLQWKIDSPQKILFISMEMGHADLKHFVEKMAQVLSKEENLLLQENLLLMPVGSSILLSQSGNQVKILNYLDKYSVKGVIFDSLGVALEKNNDEIVNNTFDFINAKVRRERSIFVWFIHHNRKPQVGNKKPTELSDLYGSQYIGAHATTVLNLWEENKEEGILEVSCLKLRMASKFDPFQIQRTSKLTFNETIDFEAAKGIGKSAESKPSDKPSFGGF